MKPDEYTDGFTTPCPCELHGVESGSDCDMQDDLDMYDEYAKLLGVAAAFVGHV